MAFSNLALTSRNKRTATADLSTAANARDFITAQYFSDEDILVAAIIKGLA